MWNNESYIDMENYKDFMHNLDVGYDKEKGWENRSGDAMEVFECFFDKLEIAFKDIAPQKLFSGLTISTCFLIFAFRLPSIVVYSSPVNPYTRPKLTKV